jgi:LysM repeat protein
MDIPSLPISIEREHHQTFPQPACSRPLALRFVAWGVVTVWRLCVDWRTKRSFLTRATAHLSILVLALITIFLSGVGLPGPQAVVGEALGANSAALAGTELSMTPEATLLPTPAFSNLHFNTDTVSRQPVPLTTIPDRPRARIISYIVQSGDTIYDIATRFGLLPETLVWSNREAINDAPWLIQPGLELFILPVNGVYYTVAAGDTVESIAAEHGVEPAALYNEWNDLGDTEDGAQPREGQLLVVPGGEGDEVIWTPPPRYPSPGPAGYSYGICGGAGVTGPGANGWFIYPTGSSRVSGWYFHDARNPTHIGLDYACRTGDPIVAADNGVVTIAGWNGGYGILIEINHGNGFVTRYGHFSQLAVGCGQAVYQGDLLGYCGSTGWSSGAHLHFEIRSGGSPQDPQAYLP